MGMWQGLYTGLQNVRERQERERERQERRDLLLEEREIRQREREEDMAFRREMFNSQILETRREAMMRLLAERREQSRAVQQQINGAVSLGIERPAAEALYRSGQLGLVVNSLQEQDLSRNQINAISQEVMRQLGERASSDSVAAAIVGVATGGADLTDPREAELAITESILQATGIEELQELYGGVLEIGGAGPGMSPFDISVTTAGVDQTEDRRIRSAIIERLQPLFGPNTFEVTSTGDYVFAPNAPTDVVNLVTRLSDRVVDVVTQPGAGQMDSVTAIRTFTNPIIAAREAGVVDVGAINANLPTLFDQGADPFLQTVIEPVTQMPNVSAQPEPIPVPGDTDVGDAMTAMTNARPGLGASRRDDRRGGTAPTTGGGFGFDIEEELDR